MADAAPSRWERFWFGEASLARLALFRIVLLVAAFDAVWNVSPPLLQLARGEVQGAFVERHWDPIYGFELLGLGPPDPLVLRCVWGGLLVSIACGILGLFTRAACATVAVLAVYWIGSEYSFGKPHHTCVALVFALAALPCAPSGARYSLDALRRRLQAAREGRVWSPPERAEFAAFPLRVAQLTIALGYFFAGATKLARSGLEWANGYTLMGIMTECRSPWSEAFTDSPTLLVLLSLGLLLGQLGFPLIFLGGVWRWLFLPLVTSFHLLAMMTMATGPFLTLWFVLSAFVALERVPRFVARHAGSGSAWRRLAIGLAGSGFLVMTVRIYFHNKPGALVVLLAPVAFALLLRALPAWLPPLHVRSDPGSQAARRAVAWLAACDWAGRFTFEACADGGEPLVVRTQPGRELRGSQARRALLARAPLAWFRGAWLALAADR